MLVSLAIIIITTIALVYLIKFLPIPYPFGDLAALIVIVMAIVIVCQKFGIV